MAQRLALDSEPFGDHPSSQRAKFARKMKARRAMLTVTVSKEINGKTVKISTKALDEDSTTIAEFNGEIQAAIGKLLDKE